MSIISNDGMAEGDGPMAAINVTSLVDVMFCLLIAFMVASPLMTPEHTIDVNLPNARGAEISEEEFLYRVVSVDARGKVFLGVVQLSDDVDEMTDQLVENPKLKEDGMVFVQGDKTVPYDRVVDVLVALEEAGVHEVGFVTDPRGAKKR